MHPVASQVEVPLDQLERILLRRAVQGFTGQVVVGVRVLPEAVRAVELSPETHEFQQVRLRSPGWNEMGRDKPTQPTPPNREAIVRKMIAENHGKVCLGTTVSKITAHFDDGELRKLEWVLPN